MAGDEGKKTSGAAAKPTASFAESISSTRSYSFTRARSSLFLSVPCISQVDGAALVCIITT